MIDVKNIEGIFFIGIGGIGMSALARYFRAGGFDVFGYDRSESQVTTALEQEGCMITFEDDPASLPVLFRDRDRIKSTLVVFTPAIPASNRILTHFRDGGYRILKRSEVLGEISKETDTLAVSGTHGKTTVSTMLAHMLKQSAVDCSAFLGGISKNYNSNLLLGSGRYTVMEADEYDRSFHRLNPLMAVVTAMDPDHIEIYGDYTSMIEGYNQFFGKIRKGGTLVMNRSIADKVVVPEYVRSFTYGFESESDYHPLNIIQAGDAYTFSLKTPEGVIRDLVFPFPGKINIENATAAAAIALMTGVSEPELRKSLLTFSGVRRRFDIRINRKDLVYIDDYAHHPEEIRALINSIREYYGNRKITGIFQPHLFTRTRDHAAGFAEILDRLDEVILLPVYPARENPIPGVSSEMILDRMTISSRRLLQKSDIPEKLDLMNVDVLLTIGAGDIDRLVVPIEDTLKRVRVR